MSITSRQDLADYALRQLGGGVINVEISDDQMEDAVEKSIQFYVEYHYDGVEKDYLAHKITGTTITVTSGGAFVVGNTLRCTTKGISAQILTVNGNTLTIARTQPGNTFFAIGDTVTTDVASSTVTAVTLGDVDNGWIYADDGVVGVARVLNLTNTMASSEMLFNANYQIMMSEIQNITSSNTNYYYSTMQYLGHIDFILRKEKDFRFNRRMNKIFLDINWNVDVAVGNIVVVEVFRALDDATYPKMLNDRWLKAYTTAQFKKINGTNLKKYTGMQLPGGLTYNGQQIYDEAISEITILEKEALDSGAPLGFAVG